MSARDTRHEIGRRDLGPIIHGFCYRLWVCHGFWRDRHVEAVFAGGGAARLRDCYRCYLAVHGIDPPVPFHGETDSGQRTVPNTSSCDARAHGVVLTMGVGPFPPPPLDSRVPVVAAHVFADAIQTPTQNVDVQPLSTPPGSSTGRYLRQAMQAYPTFFQALFSDDMGAPGRENTAPFWAGIEHYLRTRSGRPDARSILNAERKAALRLVSRVASPNRADAVALDVGGDLPRAPAIARFPATPQRLRRLLAEVRSSPWPAGKLAITLPSPAQKPAFYVWRGVGLLRRRFRRRRA
jgi:hypothetical protein